MTVKHLVGTLARTGVNTAVSVIRHPIRSASMAVGFATGAAEAGVHLVRCTTSGRSPVEPDEAAEPDEVVVEESVAAKPPLQEEPLQEESVEESTGQDPAVQETSGPPEPQVVPKPVPEIGDLPEPDVIWANDDLGEPVHTEPKAASRDSEHGGQAGDREEADGYAEEIPLADETDESETLVWTSESEQRQG
jgi:hypothetical protein